MAVYNNPYIPQSYTTPQPVYQPSYQQVQPAYQQSQPAYQQSQPVYQQPQIDWEAVSRACQTLAGAAANVPSSEYATKADLEKLKKEILEGVKGVAKSDV